MNPLSVALENIPQLWRGDQLARSDETVASGFPSLDQALPGSGWPKGTLIELLGDEQGIGELRLLAPALQRLAQEGQALALVAPPHVPYAPAFAQIGIAPSSLLIVEPADEKDRWWAAEQILRAQCAGALLFWPRLVNDQRLRRLQVAAQDGPALSFVFGENRWAGHPSPATLRMQLSVVGSRLCINVHKRRGSILETPLLLALPGGLELAGDAAAKPLPLAFRPRAASPRPGVRFNKHYPVGEAHIWNRALARADEVRRVPGNDPRTRKPARQNRIEA